MPTAASDEVAPDSARSESHDQLIMSAMDAERGSICIQCSHWVEPKKSLRTTSVFNIGRTFFPSHSTPCSGSWLPLEDGEDSLPLRPPQACPQHTSGSSTQSSSYLTFCIVTPSLQSPTQALLNSGSKQRSWGEKRVCVFSSLKSMHTAAISYLP